MPDFSVNYFSTKPLQVLENKILLYIYILYKFISIISCVILG